MEHRKMLGALVLSLLLGVAGCPTDDQDDDTGDDDAGDDDTGDDDTGDDDWDPRFDSLVAAMHLDIEQSDASAVSVAVLEGGEITFAQAFGSAHPDMQLEVTAETLFQMGSVSKMMTGTGVLQQVEAGTLSLDDTLDDVLPELEFALGPDWDEQITVRHLLTHQGGFVDDWCGDGPSEDEALSEFAHGEFAQTWSLMAQPGNFFNYSNPNWGLAGLVTEAADGQGRMWADILEQDVFGPLGMDRTFPRRASVAADGDYATGTGYYLDGGGYEWGTVELDYTCDHAFYRPAGLIWTTPSQMVRFAEFLMEGNEEVLGDTLQQELVTPQISQLVYGDEWQYSYGVELWTGISLGAAWPPTEWFPIEFWFHSGSTYSFTTFLFIFPEQDIAVSMMASGRNAYMGNTQLWAINELADLPDPIDPPLPPPDPANFGAHTGRYFDPVRWGEMLAMPVDDTLYLVVPDAYPWNTERELEALTDINFNATLNGNWHDMTFIPGDGDDPSPYIRNRYWVATREGVPPARGEGTPPAAPGVLPDPSMIPERLVPFRVPASVQDGEVR